MELLLFFSLFFVFFWCRKSRCRDTYHKVYQPMWPWNPMLSCEWPNVSTGQDYSSNGAFSGIAYLQTGQCLANGEGCTLVEMNLINSACAGCGSSVDISLISPHVYNVESSFAYYNGCDGYGADCDGPNCATAFFEPEDWDVQRACQVTDVDLLIAFCANASDLVSGATGSSPASSSFTSTSTFLQPTPTTPSNTTVSLSSATSPYPVNIGGASFTTSSSSPSPSAKRCSARPSSAGALVRREPTARVAKVPRRHRALRG